MLITSGVDLDAFNALSIVAEVDHWSRSEGTFDAKGFSFGNNIRVKADTKINTTVDVDVFSANLTGQDVDIVSRVKNLDAKARGDARGPVGLAADVSAKADLTSTTKTDVDLFGSTILGRNSLDILSEHPLIKTFADTYSLSPSAIGRLDTIAQNVTNITSNISADSAATLTTKSLIVRANVPSNRSILETSIRKRKGDGRGTDEPDSPTENISREIDFDAKVNVADTGPVLAIDANGVATTQQGGVTFTDDGTTITVNPIINRGDFLGNVTFDLPGNVGTRTLKGNPTLAREQSFLGVSITNESARKLKLSQINVFNPSGRVQINRTTGIPGLFQINQSQAAPGATVLTVQNTQGILIDDDIDNPFGSTTITANTGNIVRVAEDDFIVTAQLKLEARGGNIGTSGNTDLERFESMSVSPATATDLQLIASGSIYYHHSRGLVDVTEVSATTGDIDFFAIGNVYEDDSDGDHAVDANELALFTGRNIKLSTRGSIGQSANPVEINASTAEGALQVFANNGIYLSELTDSISVERLGSSSGDIEFTLAEAAGAGQSFALTPTGRISANTGSVTLNLPDDASFPAGGQIQLQNALTINLDVAAQAGDGGASLLFNVPAIGAATATINTGPDADTLDIRQLNTPTTITTGAGNDRITLSSDANRLNQIRAATQIDTGTDVDQLIFDASGGTPGGMTGSVIASTT
ncbi:MAG: hypothetical protein MI861_08655, partial [Pirellulales bacterium]|nr:hypothetical protein [Pirellulales bacterium]